jgi:hypothetical protein
MPNSQNYVSPEQLAANRANAARSTGPRSPEGKTRSAQNARKHGFTSAAYTVVRLEDVQEVANLKDDAVEFYQPVNSQEVFAVERIALTQQAMLRAARLEAGLFTSCLNEACGLTDIPRTQIDPLLLADIEVARVQNRNFVLAEGFQHSAAKSNALSLCLRYAAQAERHYRRALDEFNRLKALRPDPSGAGGTRVVCGSGAHDSCGPVCVLPAATFGETNPIPSEVPQSEGLAGVPSPQPELIPTTPDVPESGDWEPRRPSGAPAAPVATFPLEKPGSGSPICHDVNG